MNESVNHRQITDFIKVFINLIRKTDNYFVFIQL